MNSKEQIAEILRDNIFWSPQVEGLVIHGAIGKLQVGERNSLWRGLFIGLFAGSLSIMFAAIIVLPRPSPKTVEPIIRAQDTVLLDHSQIISAKNHSIENRDDSEVANGKSRYRYHEGHIIASQPNPTWFWIVFDSAGWKKSKWRNEKPKYPKGATLTMTE